MKLASSDARNRAVDAISSGRPSRPNGTAAANWARASSASSLVHYLVGTPKGRLTRLEKHLIAQPWHAGYLPLGLEMTALKRVSGGQNDTMPVSNRIASFLLWMRLYSLGCQTTEKTLHEFIAMIKQSRIVEKLGLQSF